MLTPVVTAVRIARQPNGDFLTTVKVPQHPQVPHNVPALSDETLQWERDVYRNGIADGPSNY